MKKIVHLIPYDGTGGVEVAARSVGAFPAGLDFSVQNIYPHVPGYHERQVTFGLRPLVSAFRKIRRQRPDLLIVSLWRACIVGLLVKLTSPSTRLVLMLHNTRDAQWVDKIITRATGLVADEWWGDSAATLYGRLKPTPDKPMRVISFVTRRLQPSADPILAPNFIFWGRINRQKGVDRAISLFTLIREIHVQATFTVIGPDGGALAGAKLKAAQLGVSDCVVFRGEMNMQQIQREAATASFYLQTSHYEGMAMSVVEAMQLGLVPIVTPVGEIAHYCRDKQNAILVESMNDAADAVSRVLQDPVRYAAIRTEAMSTWSQKPLYAESIADACRSALSVPSRASA